MTSRQLGHVELAHELADDYVEARRGAPEGLDVLSLRLQGQVADKELRDRLAMAHDRLVGIPTLSEAAQRVSEHGRDTRDVEALSNASVQDLVLLFMGHSGSGHVAFVKACINVAASGDRSALLKNVAAALRVIAESSPLNKLRVSQIVPIEVLYQEPVRQSG